ncbi:hypothetical protein [Bacillus sp. B1-b2]|uniref:hypothetical protein n=1 Tax=Bacillus sp. B1-b2 TaxID=2653201 RepID=UPI0012618D68|nr:hypothetical protein [Bacillus sp. B1-b2]KAB7672079.1 hypothetical protein F9279_03945 [Bacillus sp. B1-b2]
MNLHDYLSFIFGEKWGKKQVGIFAGQGQHEEIKSVLGQVKTIEEWNQFSDLVFSIRGLNISQTEPNDVWFILLEELLEEKA